MPHERRGQLLLRCIESTMLNCNPFSFYRYLFLIFPRHNFLCRMANQQIIKRINYLCIVLYEKHIAAGKAGKRPKCFNINWSRPRDQPLNLSGSVSIPDSLIICPKYLSLVLTNSYLFGFNYRPCFNLLRLLLISLDIHQYLRKYKFVIQKD